MSKRFVMVAFLIGAASGVAAADAKSDGQAKVDAAKTEVCEKSKKFIGTQAAKGRCATESASAQKITCSPSTAKEVFDLMNRCIKSPVRSDSPVKADNSAPATGGNRCRALDVGDNKLIAEVEDRSSIKCTGRLMTALKKQWCTAANKGKKFEYISDFDHVIGTGRFAQKVKQRKSSLTCHTVAK
jgi:hypothetical protein